MYLFTTNYRPTLKKLYSVHCTVYKNSPHTISEEEQYFATVEHDVPPGWRGVLQRWPEQPLPGHLGRHGAAGGGGTHPLHRPIKLQQVHHIYIFTMYCTVHILLWWISYSTYASWKQFVSDGFLFGMVLFVMVLVRYGSCLLWFLFKTVPVCYGSCLVWFLLVVVPVWYGSC